MATSQADLDAYITGTLTPALTALEAQGSQVNTAVQTLLSDYEAAIAAGNTAPDLGPQLTELQALTAKLASDQSAATSLGTQITTALPPSTPTPEPSTDAKKAE